jgi:Na+-transporting methylmalonyl-CoA/oxaloacetate decarboxylase gamma subunit
MPSYRLVNFNNIAIFIVVVFSALLIGAYFENRFGVLDPYQLPSNNETVVNEDSKSKIDSLDEQLQKLSNNWLSLAGLILTFSGLILVLINLSILFNFNQRASEVISESRDSIENVNTLANRTKALRDNYRAIIDKSSPQELLSTCYVIYRKKCRIDELRGKTKTLDGIYSLLQTFIYLSSYLYEVKHEIRGGFIREIAKEDIDVLKDLRDAILRSGNLRNKLFEDLRYLNVIIDEHS